MEPKISVIIPCHNQGEYLINACNSIINQTYANWEVFIIDDFSKDNTREVSNEIVLKDSRFTYIYSENKSSAISRNDGLKLVTGDYVQFLDADDEISNMKFEESLKYGCDFDLIISNFYLFKESKDEKILPYCDLTKAIFDYSNILLKWDIDYSIPIHCGFFKKETLGNLLFNTKLKVKEDWVFWLAFFKKNPKVKFIDKDLAFYRLQINSKTQNRNKFHKNSFDTLNYIQNSLGIDEAKLFSERIIKELLGERAKSDYLFKIKTENEEYINKQEETINKQIETINKQTRIIVRIKKSLLYKTLVKVELFFRGIKKIK
jgi:glycosyltransferase involved in cell wall biosynthesis